MTTDKDLALHTYETIRITNDKGDESVIQRLKVPGGWIYYRGDLDHIDSTFVPEPFELLSGMLDDFTPGPVDV